jgi:RecA/RadA recombinase
MPETGSLSAQTARRSAEVRARMHERRDPAVLAREQQVGVALAHALHRVVGQIRTGRDRRERLGLLHRHGRDADALVVDEIAAEVRRAERNRIARQHQFVRARRRARRSWRGARPRLRWSRGRGRRG